MSRAWSLGSRLAAAIGFLLVIVVPAAREARSNLAGGDDLRHARYRAIAAWISQRYPGTRVAAPEVGYLGWYGDFQTVDLLGLVSPVAPEAVRRGALRPLLDTLDADLLLLPCAPGALQQPIIGRPRGFWREWRLTAVFAREGPYLLFRRRGLPPRGDVLVDLLARQPGIVRRVSYTVRDGLQLPALELPAGTALRLRLARRAGIVMVAATAAGPPPGHTGAARTVLALRSGRRVSGWELDERQWRVARLAVGARDEAIEAVCRGPRGCLLAMPHLVARRHAAAPVGGRGERTARGSADRPAPASP
jgi:hypothetical protein